MPRQRPTSANPRLTWLIEQLGGTGAVAEAVGTSAATVSKWTQPGRESSEPDGLPRMKHFILLLELAGRGPVALTADWLIEGRNLETDQNDPCTDHA